MKPHALPTAEPLGFYPRLSGRPFGCHSPLPLHRLLQLTPSQAKVYLLSQKALPLLEAFWELVAAPGMEGLEQREVLPVYWLHGSADAAGRV